MRKTERPASRSNRKPPESIPDIPIPLWEEDFSAVKIRIEKLRASGIVDWRSYLENHPEEVHACLSLVRVRSVNAAALALFQYTDKKTFLRNPPLPYEKEWRIVMREELIALAEGRQVHESDLEMKAFDGEPLFLRRRIFLAQGCESDWSRVIVAPVDIGVYKKTEHHLLTEVEWGSFLLNLYETSARLTEGELFDHVLEQAVHFTDSRIGFFYVVSGDRKALVLRSWLGEPAVDLPNEAAISIPLEEVGMVSECIRLKRPMVYHSKSPRHSIPGLPAGHPPIRRLLSVPVMDGDDVVCVFGVGNKESPYQTRDLTHFQLVAYGLNRIIKQRRTVETLMQSEELFRLLTQHFPVPIAVFHERGRAEFLNDRFLSMFGYDLTEIPDLNTFWRRLLLEKEFRSRPESAWGKKEEGADQAPADFSWDDCRMRSKDGRGRIVDVLGATIHHKRLILLNDVTAHKQAEEETIRRTEELEILAKISTAMRAAQSRSEIYSILVNQLAVLMNAEGAALSLRDPASGDSIVELGCHRWKELAGMRLPSEENQNRDLPAGESLWRKNGRLHTPSAEAQMMHGLTNVAHAPLISNGQIIGAIWIGRFSPIGSHEIRLLTAIGEMGANAIQRQTLHEDLQVQLNALRQMQARLVQSEKLAAIGQLAAGIAHELNNPLTSVVLYSQLVQQEKLSGRVQGNVEKVVAEALRAGKIVHGLLDFARQRPIHREAVSVNEALRNSLGLISYEIEADGAKVELKLEPGLPTIKADLYQLTQVFINLIQNSIQAMHGDSGRRELKIATACGPSIHYLPGAEPRRMVRISFTDTGPGIPEENLTRIFDPFFTTKPEGSGTGLGLSICHGIVGEHEGNIWVDSKIGKGTTFFIELPVATTEEEKRSQKEEQPIVDSTGARSRILIIDDEPNVQDVLAKSLTSRGYSVETAGNGEEGLAHVAKSEFDVILCDFRMPGFSGMDFYRRIQSDKPHLATRIIFITGDTANLATRRFVEENDLNILEKPFELPDLVQMIHLVDEKTPG